MKCKEGFKEENGKCVKEKKTYCDTNILSAFLNRDDLINRFGRETARKYPHIAGRKDESTGIILKNLGKCQISKKALINDLKGHQASMGAILTSIHLKDVDVVEVDGFKRGKKLFEKACESDIPDLDKFKRGFCIRNKLRKNLKANQIEDIRHIGSSMKLGSTEFLTGDNELISLNKNKGEIESFLN